MTRSPYDAGFFRNQAADSRRSADRIVPIVMKAVEPKSVVDVGCGVGTWLAAFNVAGVERLLGVDGDHVDRAQLQVPETCFKVADLATPFAVDDRFDLAMSLEVAEHLPPDRSRSFVADLTSLAPAVLFSAAVPGQGGVGHINERWQDEWAETFAARGFYPVDPVRAQVWSDHAVAPWYAQNTLLYVGRRRPSEASALPLRLVHPRLFEQRAAAERENPDTLRALVKKVPDATRRSLRHRFR